MVVELSLRNLETVITLNLKNERSSHCSWTLYMITIIEKSREPKLHLDVTSLA